MAAGESFEEGAKAAISRLFAKESVKARISGVGSVRSLKCSSGDAGLGGQRTPLPAQNGSVLADLRSIGVTLDAESVADPVAYAFLLEEASLVVMDPPFAIEEMEGLVAQNVDRVAHRVKATEAMKHGTPPTRGL